MDLKPNYYKKKEDYFLFCKICYCQILKYESFKFDFKS